MLQTLYSPTILRGCSKNPTWIKKISSCHLQLYLSIFMYIRGSTYIRRTERILSTRIFEHLPKNLILNGSKLPTSAIGRHILDSGHVVDRNQSFKIIARMKNSQLLRFAEASAIRRIKPDLCVQKEFVVHLALPW